MHAGRRIGEYEILGELGRGGMGAVFRCHDPRLDRVVAVKVLLGLDGELPRRRFEREVNALASLRHPNLVTLHAAGEHQGRPYVVLDLLEGEPLSERLLHSGPLDPEEAARLTLALAEGLAHAHEQAGVLHRDVKPENVLVRPDGQPVLIDFGLARSLDPNHSRLTRTGTFLGTPGYWAPEQMRGELTKLGPPTDVYGLGATLYAALAGEPPFVGASLPELLNASLRAPAPPSRRQRGIPPELDAICLRCLQPEPAARYPTMEALAAELRRFLLKAPERSRARAPLGLALVGLASLLVLGLLAVLPNEEPAPPPPATARPAPPSLPPNPPPTSPPPDPTPSAAPPATPRPTPRPAPEVRIPSLAPDPTALLVAQTAREALLEGVRLAPPPDERYVPGPIYAVSPDAFAVLTGHTKGRSQIHEPLVAAAFAGRGRVVACGHSMFLTPDGFADPKTDGSRLLANALRWATRGNAPAPATVGLVRDEPQLVLFLRTLGFRVRALPDDPFALEGVDLVVWSGRALRMSFANVEPMLRFVREGGGLVAATTPWGAHQILEGRGVAYPAESPLAHVLSGLGLLAMPTGHLQGTAPGGYSREASQPESAHAGQALEDLLARKQPTELPALLTQSTQAFKAIDGCLAEAPLLDRILQRSAEALARDHPRPERPLRVGDKPDVRLALSTLRRRLREAPPAGIRPLPGHDAFPGAVPAGAPRASVELILRTRGPSWLGTGLYAPAGEVIEVVPPPDLNTGWRVRIGCQVDRLTRQPELLRWPEPAWDAPLAGPTRLASPLGGLIYLIPPADPLFALVREPVAEGPPLPFRIAGAVAAPRYRLDDPAATAWADTRRAPAPWAELETDQLILSLPSALVREVEDPAPALRWWTRVLAAAERLVGQGPRTPLRLVADVQLVEGTVRPGYPTVCDLSLLRGKEGAPSPLFDPAALGRGEPWLPLRTLLANLLPEGTRFAGAGQVHAGLLALYALMEGILDRPAWSHPRIQSTRTQLSPLLRAGRRATSWKRASWGGITAYVLVARAFGWEPFQQVFRAYLALPVTERPRGETAQRSEWVVRLSRAVGRDLSAHLQRWGLEIPRDVAERLKDLEVWEGE